MSGWFSTNGFKNDHLFISHYHDPDDGFANLEEESARIEDDRASESSVVHMKNGSRSQSLKTICFQSEVRLLLDPR